MGIRFTKMHGLGNDFIVIDASKSPVHLSAEQIQRLARRDIGIGFDQCLLLEKSPEPGIDFFYRIFNANGEEVGQCGNGARCLARFIQRYQLSPRLNLSVATKTTRLQLQINPDDSVTVDMGAPQFAPSHIPLLANTQQALYEIPLPNEKSCAVHAVSIGNPHAILLVDNCLAMDIDPIGSAISKHPLFPEETNVGFMQLCAKNHIQLRVFERGCGETRACGSGAVAAAIVGQRFHHLAQTVTVSLPGGDLFVHWSGQDGQSAYLTGAATFVYEGQIL